jgi:hypothetical protein
MTKNAFPEDNEISKPAPQGVVGPPNSQRAFSFCNCFNNGHTLQKIQFSFFCSLNMITHWPIQTLQNFFFFCWQH